jgi:hypothetical protein
MDLKAYNHFTHTSISTEASELLYMFRVTYDNNTRLEL